MHCRSPWLHQIFDSGSWSQKPPLTKWLQNDQNWTDQKVVRFCFYCDRILYFRLFIQFCICWITSVCIIFWPKCHTIQNDSSTKIIKLLNVQHRWVNSMVVQPLCRCWIRLLFRMFIGNVRFITSHAAHSALHLNNCTTCDVWCDLVIHIRFIHFMYSAKCRNGIDAIVRFSTFLVCLLFTIFCNYWARFHFDCFVILWCSPN